MAGLMASSLAAVGRPGVLLDHLLHVLLKPHEHLLPDVDVEVHLDRLVGRPDGYARAERRYGGYPSRQSPDRSDHTFHFLPPGGGDCCDGGVGLGALAGCSFFVVLSTSTLSAGESTGNGITGAMTWVGSLKDFAIWISARKGPLMFTFNFRGSLLKARWTRPAMMP